MDFIDDFIQEYRNNPCLWKADSANYKNRSKRQEAYMKLIETAAKHGEHYNVERTKQKINNLRCAFRHQLKKYNELKSKGEKEEPSYCPKRKYFESLMFLKDEENRDKRTKQQDNSANETISIISVGNNGKNEARLLSTETESGSVDVIVDTDKTTSNSGTSAEDPLQVPSNLFSDICKEIQKENNDPDDDQLNEEGTTVNISVISEKVTPPDIEEIVIAPMKKDQVYVIENSPVSLSTHNNTSNISSPQKQFQQQNTSKSRKRSSSFSSQHSNETTDTATPVKASKSDITLDIENLLSLACKNFQKSTVDHHTSFGEIVAHKLRSMEFKQALYAEKIISDILYQGQMRYLSPAAIERCSHLERLQQHEHK